MKLYWWFANGRRLVWHAAFVSLLTYGVNVAFAAGKVVGAREVQQQRSVANASLDSEPITVSFPASMAMSERRMFQSLIYDYQSPHGRVEKQE